jgi:hypothetical protein
MNHSDELTEHDRPSTDDLLNKHASHADDDDLSAPEVAVDSEADSEALADPAASHGTTVPADTDLNDDRLNDDTLDGDRLDDDRTTGHTLAGDRVTSDSLSDQRTAGDTASGIPATSADTAADGTAAAPTNGRGIAGDRVGDRAPVSDEPEDSPLFANDEVEQFRTQWRELQAAFVDNPRDAVQEADGLVAEVMQNLAATFADHKHSLEDQWSRGDQVDTEELRVALRRYRSFFNKLLAV